MATLKDAEKARRRESESLRQHGAHAVEVEPEDTEENSFALVAYFKEPPTKSIPDGVEVGRGRLKVRVPLRVRVARPFELE